MNYRILILIVFIPFIASSLLANTELYEYQELTELLERYENNVDEQEFKEFEQSNFLLKYRNDFLLSNDNRIFLSASNQNIETNFYKKEQERTRVFAKYYSDNTEVGFGSFRPVFGLGTIYKRSSTQDYLNKVFSTSDFDLQGIFASYHKNPYKLSLYYSKNTLNNAVDSEGNRSIVYYESTKSDLEQAGLIIKRDVKDVEIGLLTAQFSSSDKLKQFAFKKNFFLFSNYVKYENDNVDIRYETDFLFSKFTHNFWGRFKKDEFTSIWTFESIPNYSLNWLNSGISNKYNTNTEIYSGNCSFPIATLSFKVGSELKSNHKIKQWRSRTFSEIETSEKLSYKIVQEIYRDYSDIKHTKYTHRFKVNLFTFEDSKIEFNYTINNKLNSGLAHMYQVEFDWKLAYGKLKTNLKVLDNYKNEEIVQDTDDNIIATFYDKSEDFMILLNYQSPNYRNFILASSFIYSIFNDRVNSLKIELSYLL